MLITLILIAAALILVVRFFLKLRSVPELLLGDDNWDGTFPCEAPAFSGPAYVYKDGTEIPGIRFNVPILGYRAAETLIVSADCGYGLPAEEVLSFAKQKHARVPEWADIALLEENRDKIDALKLGVEDFPLPKDFWVIVDGKPEIYRTQTHTVMRPDQRFLGKRLAEVVLLIDR